MLYMYSNYVATIVKQMKKENVVNIIERRNYCLV